MLIRLKRNWIPYLCFRFDSKIILCIKSERNMSPTVYSFEVFEKSNDIYKSKDSLTI